MAADLTYIRVSIGDTDATDYTFSDVTINAFLTKFVNENLVIGKLFRGLASIAAGGTSVSIGKVSESKSPDVFLKQAEYFESLAMAEGVDATGGDMVFDDVVEIGNSEFSIEEILVNNLINQGII
jgi:hypothetical protein